jgi:hypothetical protein
MRDVTKILSEADLLKLRDLLRDAPMPQTVQSFTEYPRMLFAPDWYPLWVITKNETDHLKVKQAQEQIKKHQVIVDNLEDEEDYLTDGWVSDPNELATAFLEKDPRIPDGRAGRIAAKDARHAREKELIDIRRRYAELTGRRLVDEPELVAAPIAEDPVTEVEAVDEENPALDGADLALLAESKQARVRRNAQRSAQPRA